MKKYIITIIISVCVLLSSIIFVLLIDSDIWFEDINSSIILNNTDKDALIHLIAQSFSSQHAAHAFSDTVKDDAEPRIVFISICDSETTAKTAIGKGKGLLNAVMDAVENLKNKISANYTIKYISLDIVNKVETINEFDFDLPMPSDNQLKGIALERKSQIAFIPGIVKYNNLLDINNKLSINKLALYIKNNSNTIDSLKIFEQIIFDYTMKIYYFSTIKIFHNVNDTSGNQNESNSRTGNLQNRLMNSAKSGIEYLIQSVNYNGKFDYLYDPNTDTAADEYNILRHAGTVYSMLEYYEFNKTDTLLTAINKAIGYLKNSYIRFQENKAFVVEDDSTKLGGNALAALALSKYEELTNKNENKVLISKLLNWIMETQNSAGEFTIHKLSFSGNKKIDMISDYYPGEAIFALARAYKILKDKKLLDYAEKGAQYLIHQRESDNTIDDVYQDHWLLYALNELYRYRPKKIYLEHAFKIADSIIKSQNMNPQNNTLLYGYYHDIPLSTPTAVRSEGLCAAYNLSVYSGYTNRIKDILNSIDKGIEFQLQTQFTPKASMYMQKPDKCIGGFYNSMDNFSIRIDYVQHNISSILLYYKILRE